MLRGLANGTFFGATLISQSALAQYDPAASRCNDAVLEAVGKHFSLSGFSYPADGMDATAANGGLLAAGVCRRWPANDQKAIGAFAYDAGVEMEKRLLVVLVEGPKIIASYDGKILEGMPDAFDKYQFKLDTAAYTLSPGTRAFGVRFSDSNCRCEYDACSGDMLTLFVVDGTRLRPVLSEHMAYSKHGMDSCGEGMHMIEAKIIISLEKTATNGFADLRLSVKSKAKSKTPTTVVKYDGKQYDLAPWNHVFGTWWEGVDPDAEP